MSLLVSTSALSWGNCEGNIESVDAEGHLKIILVYYNSPILCHFKLGDVTRYEIANIPKFSTKVDPVLKAKFEAEMEETIKDAK